ncbi:DksA/TraR family C4-type zinc finger protein [Gallaecimonas mangrovi]|uniref:DksA/TraR family C4-type zinc finger protein n=1 Tax=Gallaecimonas mangrovi TaxID=2291597 RepID=UPI000E1FDCD2|nr:DksA/TraR family C4-type zinc finger protein [Gallaecimonas mangrovi]
MAVGWAGDDAVTKQIDSTIEDAVANVRNKLGKGPSRKTCLECGADIPIKRQQALPGVQYCVHCQQEMDKDAQKNSLYNRRGSKDSQLR